MQFPAGYEIIQQSGDNVMAENDHVLPRAYFTADIIAQELFEEADPLEQLDMITRKTVVDLPQKTAQENLISKDRITSPKYMEPYTPEFTAGSSAGRTDDHEKRKYL